jgi:hypothetical protein
MLDNMIAEWMSGVADAAREQGAARLHACRRKELARESQRLRGPGV